MPSAAPNSISNARPNVTATIARHVAVAVDVCRAGDLVALHLHTTRGTVTVTIGEAAFVAAARGPVDSNGNPWRTGQMDDARLKPAGEDAEKSKLPRGEATARCPQAWESLKQDLTRSIDDVASEHGLQKSTLQNWIIAHHPGELVHLRHAAGLNCHGNPSKTTPKDVFARDERCAAAWAWMNDPANEWQTTRDVAPRFDITPMRLAFWCTRHNRTEYYQLKRAKIIAATKPTNDTTAKLYREIIEISQRTGRPMSAICREHGFSAQRIYTFRHSTKSESARKPILKPAGHLL